MNIKSLVTAVTTALGRVSERIGALADAIEATFEPATVVEVCRAVYGEDFAVARKPETDAEKLAKARYDAIRYAITRLIVEGRWPDNRKSRKPRTPRTPSGDKSGGKSGGKAGGKADAADAAVAIKAGDVAALIEHLNANGWTRRQLDKLAQAIMAS